MTNSNTQTDTFNKSLFEVCRKCYLRTKEKIDWFCDPEGPSISKFIFNSLIIIFGALFFILGLYLLICPYKSLYFINDYLNCCNKIPIYDFYKYIGCSLIFTGGTLFYIGRYARKEELGTGVYNEEIDNLISEIEQNKHKITESKQINYIEKEIKNLKKYKNKPSEVSYLRLISLRKILVDTYDNDTLIAHAKSDLMDFGYIAGKESDEYIEYNHDFNEHMNRGDYEKDNKLKEKLKTIREKINWEYFIAGKGEAILDCLTRWSFPAFISLFIAGIIPLTNGRFYDDLYALSILHWAMLGVSGAILYTVNHMRKLDTTKVGEDEGNLVLRKTLLGMVIGGVSAILLYSAVHGCVLGGKALPKLCVTATFEQDIFETNSLSIFWALISGFSAKLFEGLVGKSQIATTT